MFMQEINKWKSFMQAIDMFSEDFMADGRTDDMGRNVIHLRLKAMEKYKQI